MGQQEHGDCRDETEKTNRKILNAPQLELFLCKKIVRYHRRCEIGRYKKSGDDKGECERTVPMDEVVDPKRK